MNEELIRDNPAAAVPESYVWEVPGKPVVVCLDFDLIDRLLQEVMRGFGAMPRRSLEMGGLLIGRVEDQQDGRSVVTVEDFEPVPCRHARGSAWLLTEEEQARFRETLARWKKADGRRTYTVGFYRSHTREGMGLTPEDLEMFQTDFPDAADIALLVKPFATRASVGALFIREGGGIQSHSSYREFPFNRRDLGGQPPSSLPLPEVRESEPRWERPPISSAPPPPQLETGMSRPTLENNPFQGIPIMSSASTTAITSDQLTMGFPVARRDESGKSRKTGWVWIPLSFIFLFFGMLLGMLVATGVRSQAPAAIRQDAYTLGLSVAVAGESLHVRWERTSPAIQASSRGILHINDGGNFKSVTLDSQQLQNGSVIYRRASGDIKFRLEVFARERVSVSETAEFRQ